MSDELTVGYLQLFQNSFICQLVVWFVLLIVYMSVVPKPFTELSVMIRTRDYTDVKQFK